MGGCLNFWGCSGSVGLLPQGLETRSWGRGAKSGTGVASFPFPTFDDLTAVGVVRATYTNFNIFYIINLHYEVNEMAAM